MVVLRMKKDKPHIFYFFPLASIGGTESVHADIMKALSAYQQTTLIRYESNVWKGQAFAQSKKGKEEGRAMLSVFANYSNVTFASRYLEAPRFGRFIRKQFIKRLAKKINQGNSMVIFWHRESIDYIISLIDKSVPIIDIIHNNSNDQVADPIYLVNDWAERINRRVLVSKGLLKWIEPLYTELENPELLNRISFIEHAVNKPSEIPLKNEGLLKILFVGRDAIEKRIHLIEEIAQKCLEQNLQFEFSLIGPEKKEDTSNLKWLGSISNRNEIEKHYSDSHVILLTSSSEGFPKVVAEAMAFGCIPVVTNVGGIPVQIRHEQNGMITNPEHCVVESIEILTNLYNNQQLRKELSRNSYLYATKHFGFEDFKEKWLTIIHEFS